MQTVRAVQSEFRGAIVSKDFEAGMISRINVYPIKSFPGVTVSSSHVMESGALKWDRRFALAEPSGEFVNLKRVPELHEIRADFQLDVPSVRIWTGHSVTARTFHLDDDRESPSYLLLDLLKDRGGEMAYYDPHVPVIRPNREHPHWAGTLCEEWTEANISSYDVVIIATHHERINYEELGKWAPLIVDTRNAMKGMPLPAGKLWKSLVHAANCVIGFRSHQHHG